ncbi:conjugal transfer protein TraD [Sphingomonas koreensis]|uniref:conjugal transfer protein TraD n=1 Tax=Sphingomonas koreensis TaxID=93064 RepID=UPI00082B8853|nr:conjugal transfer protein TraD [Sphingomonas koreensis]PJI88463.1 conjugative transfer protein TraD [Sphingomonas koreensis]RSU55438.1 conjugal transfer protein TraD [Sphingomonas koreensis]RSU64051.1 conjugal transfer protein TraD [Sphingomonas koreensis]
MRKPRDYDAELEALDAKAKQLKARKVQQLGELVIASGADTLPLDQLAGALLAAAGTSDAATKKAWRTRGAAFFQGTRGDGGGNRGNARGAATRAGGAQPDAADAGAA